MIRRDEMKMKFFISTCWISVVARCVAERPRETAEVSAPRCPKGAKRHFGQRSPMIRCRKHYIGYRLLCNVQFFLLFCNYTFVVFCPEGLGVNGQNMTPYYRFGFNSTFYNRCSSRLTMTYEYDIGKLP